MNPVLSLSTLLPCLFIVLSIGIVLTWRSSLHAAKRTRFLLLVLRVVSLCAISLLLLNPGKWERQQQQTDQSWPILLDSSSSMAVSQNGQTRLETALAHRDTIREHAEDAGITAPSYHFDQDVYDLNQDSPLEATGSHSNLHTAGKQLFNQLQSTGSSPKGIIVLSDGRQTHIPEHSELALQARANNTPIYAISVGDKVQEKDLIVSSPRRSITAFPQQQVQITAAIDNRNLASLSTTVRLINTAGELIAEKELKLTSNEISFHTFSVTAPEKSANFTLEIPTIEDEQRSNNNRVNVFVRILETKTRVFIAEGAPYWDSKFLAQLLRQQAHMEIHSVHRLSDTRYFRIDSGQATPTESSVDVFPDTLQQLSQYDLIILGKNSEHFLTPKRIEALKGFVRDQGGALLFSRGKPYSSKLPELAPLEPVSWTSGNTSQFSLTPTSDGQSAGLFGQALPDPDSPIWQSLPPLKDAHNVASIKPFTRVLARGSLSGQQGTFPLLMMRRYGQGVTGLVNADGLWKWDFYPEARELGNMYSEFWNQLIQWMVAYSEFLPGHDYALRASKQSIQIHQPVVLTVSYRGETTSPSPQIEITRPDKTSYQLSPAQIQGDNGLATWKTSFIAEQSGIFQARVIPHDSTPSPSINLTVKPMPTEGDNLNPDPIFLESLVKSTGGKMLTATELSAFLKEQFQTNTQSDVDADVVWSPFWVTAYLPLVLAALLAAEWFIRRRSGLT